MLDGVNILQRALFFRESNEFYDTDLGELKAFILYARAFPNKFLALVDTYNTMKSGIKNYLCIALSLLELGYQPLGIRLDSGDLV
jgi:nicotinate phosphoribosyltransferase